MGIGLRFESIERGSALELWLQSFSQATEELEREGYFVKVGNKLVDPNGDIYDSNHPVIIRAMEIRKRSGDRDYRRYPNPCGEGKPIIL